MAPRNVTPKQRAGGYGDGLLGGEGDLPGWCERETWEGSAGLAPWVPACPRRLCWGEGVSLVVICALIAAGGVTASHTGASGGGGGRIHQRLPIPAPAAPTERPRSAPLRGAAGKARFHCSLFSPSSRPSVAVEGQAEHTCLCVYLCACMYLCVHVSVCTHVRASLCMSHGCMYLSVRTCVHLCAHACVAVSVVTWGHFNDKWKSDTKCVAASGMRACPVRVAPSGQRPRPRD